MSSYIIGIDPGDSTGVAILHDGHLFMVGQDTPEKQMRLLDIALTHFRSMPESRVEVFIERYIGATRRAATRQVTAQEVIGEVRGLCRKHQVAFTQQGSSEAWACANNDRLRSLGWWQRGDDVGHSDANDANMAIRHALLGLLKTYPTVYERLLRGEIPSHG